MTFLTRSLLMVLLSPFLLIAYLVSTVVDYYFGDKAVAGVVSGQRSSAERVQENIPQPTYSYSEAG